jgi:hypothetical protein
MGILQRLFGARDALTEVEAKFDGLAKTAARISDNLDKATKALSGDRSYLTCKACGCGGNWHYKGCEVAKERGDTCFLIKGGPADLMQQEMEARRHFRLPSDTK